MEIKRKKKKDGIFLHSQASRDGPIWMADLQTGLRNASRLKKRKFRFERAAALFGAMLEHLSKIEAQAQETSAEA